MQQLGVRGDEDQFIFGAVQFERADHLVAVSEIDDRPVILAGQYLGVYPFDHARSGTQRQSQRRIAQRGQPEHPLVLVEVHQIGDARAALQIRRGCGRGHRRQLDRLRLDQPAV
ncbi:hypothetical protein SDC9_88356 [bioreactor metagenome]|uniref:Uncharacterized protein n=1 Tax=bioreactor metagenome TaxID=1076179 RepID=A0A644ZLD6_9ZZZZ